MIPQTQTLMGLVGNLILDVPIFVYLDCSYAPMISVSMVSFRVRTVLFAASTQITKAIHAPHPVDLIKGALVTIAWLFQSGVMPLLGLLVLFESQWREWDPTSFLILVANTIDTCFDYEHAIKTFVSTVTIHVALTIAEYVVNLTTWGVVITLDRRNRVHKHGWVLAAFGRYAWKRVGNNKRQHKHSIDEASISKKYKMIRTIKLALPLSVGKTVLVSEGCETRCVW